MTETNGFVFIVLHNRMLHVGYTCIKILVELVFSFRCSSNAFHGSVCNASTRTVTRLERLSLYFRKFVSMMLGGCVVLYFVILDSRGTRLTSHFLGFWLGYIMLYISNKCYLQYTFFAILNC